MFKNLKLRNYKCFSECEWNLEKLTLFSGINSGGKSSVIQGLLLCAEANEMGKREGVIDLLNGKYNSNLYSFNEILYSEADEDEFNIIVKDRDNTEFGVIYSGVEDDNSVHFEINEAMGGGFLSQNLFYLPSDRRISQYQRKGNSERIELGRENEYLAYILDRGRNRKIAADIERNLNHNDTQLFDLQVNEWLDFILPGSRVTALPLGNNGLMTLGFGMDGKLHGTNVGFGVQFVLPILIAGLVAQKNDVFIVENPELHLHPQAQSKLARFLGVVANSGVQVIIETHSDHIINGIRTSIVDQKIGLSHTDVAIYYFDLQCRSIHIKIDAYAEIDTWPEGFMEQTEKDLFELRRMRKLNEDRANN